jgi:protein-S-isoprenylcysteine O-methyltransferase Ste14
LIGIGIAVVSNNAILAVIVIAYLALTLTAAMRSEEAHLREKFGDAYDAYAQRRAPAVERTFSWPRAIHNREHHTIAGLVTGLLVLAAKMYL